MKQDSGSHPNLYKVGMKVARMSPRLFELGASALGMPNRVKSDMGLRFGNRKRGRRIGSVNIELTVRCNLRCRMCWWWGENGDSLRHVEGRVTRWSRRS